MKIYLYWWSKKNKPLFSINNRKSLRVQNLCNIWTYWTILSWQCFSSFFFKHISGFIPDKDASSHHHNVSRHQNKFLPIANGPTFLATTRRCLFSTLIFILLPLFQQLCFFLFVILSYFWLTMVLISCQRSDDGDPSSCQRNNQKIYIFQETILYIMCILFDFVFVFFIGKLSFPFVGSFQSYFHIELTHPIALNLLRLSCFRCAFLYFFIYC